MESDRKLGGHSDSLQWVTETSLPEYYISDLKLNRKVPFSPAYPATQKANLYIIACSTTYLVECGCSWWLTGCQQQVTALALLRDIAGHCPHCNWPFKTCQVFIRPKEHTEYTYSATCGQNAFACISTQRVMYISKIFKSNEICT